MGTLAIQEILETGLNPVLVAAAAGGDEFVNSDRTFFVIDNAEVGSHTVTFAVQRTKFDVPGFGEITFPALVVSVPASEQRWIKVPQAPYNDGNGKVQATYDAETSITVAAVKMPGG